MIEKKRVVRFLKEKKRGIYTVIVEMYSDVINSTGVSIALEIIKEDLEKESGDTVSLNYFSLAQAISKFKNSNVKSSGSKKKWEFKDASELRSQTEIPGKFKLD